MMKTENADQVETLLDTPNLADALENERLCRDVRVLERGYLP